MRERRVPVRLIAAAALAIAVLCGAVLAVPGSRAAVAEFFGVHGSKIVVLPTAAPGVTPTPFPTPAGIEQTAQAITPEQARAALGFDPPHPAGAGNPRALYLIRYFDVTAAVVLQYAEYDLWVLKADSGGIFQKEGEAGITIDTPEVDGMAANWLGDGTHIVMYRDRAGRAAFGSQRTVT
ncbi:MAG: hypothetical protein ACREMU_13965, partial [Gemmatimonadaceae bacterium]